MLCRTVIWLTVTVASACAVYNTIGQNLHVTNTINDEMDLLNQSPPTVIRTEENRTDPPATITGGEATVTDTSNEATGATTSPTNDEQMTQASTPGENGGIGVVVPEPSTTPAPASPDAEHNGDQDHIVLTTNGYVQGYPWHTNSGIIAYIDIPYASFETYFKEPTSPSRWNNTHQVREHNKRCPQLQGNTYVGDLDCLTLSIFTPLKAVNASVLFHIHESNFALGSGDPAIYGPEYFVSKGVILVLPNYRLGSLGFLCLDNATAPGNAALKDLTLALKWIGENIRAFGGDPANVVVSGDGSSGALVGYLALAPGSSGYFNKAITESGSVLSHWALDRDPAATANALVQRIRQISTPANTIAAAEVRIIVLAARDISFRPCVESNNNSFVSATPWTMLQTTVVNKTLMVGSASHAGAIEASNINEVVIELMNTNFERFLPNDLYFADNTAWVDVGNRVRRQYFGNDNISLGHVEEMALCYTDSYYLGPVVRVARELFRAGARVFLYEFSFVGELNRELDSINRPLNRTVRGDIVGYLFSQDGVIPSVGTTERSMVELMTDLWVSFIDYGTPTSEKVTWTELNSTTVAAEMWLSISDETQMKSLHEDRMGLWTSIYEDYFIEHNAAYQDLPGVLVFPLLYGLLKAA